MTTQHACLHASSTTTITSSDDTTCPHACNINHSMQHQSQHATSITASQHHTSTEAHFHCHHTTAASQHHTTTASHHHSITASQHNMSACICIINTPHHGYLTSRHRSSSMSCTTKCMHAMVYKATLRRQILAACLSNKPIRRVGRASHRPPKPGAASFFCLFVFRHFFRRFFSCGGISGILPIKDT